MNILIVEDDIEIQNLLNYFFKKNNYNTFTANNGIEGIKILKEHPIDLVILDLMLPLFDGKNFTKIVRELPTEYGNPFIIMLTAKTEIEDVIEGLELGADDYIKKPFDPREVILRSKKLLEKKETHGEQKKNSKLKDEVFILKELSVNTTKRQVLLKNHEIELSNKEYNLLLLFLRNIGLVLTRDKVLDFVWGNDYFSGDRSVDVYVSKLRDKIPFFSKDIKTIKGVGYKLEERK